jgi:hypothetical protein
MRSILFLVRLWRRRSRARRVKFGEDRHEFLGQRVVARHQGVGRAVTHVLGHQPVLLARQCRAAQVMHAQAAAHRAGCDAEPEGNVGHAPAQQPDQPELAKGAFAVGAKARRNSGMRVSLCHGAHFTPTRNPVGFGGRNRRWRQGRPVALGVSCARPELSLT